MFMSSRANPAVGIIADRPTPFPTEFESTMIQIITDQSLPNVSKGPGVSFGLWNVFPAQKLWDLKEELKSEVSKDIWMKTGSNEKSPAVGGINPAFSGIRVRPGEPFDAKRVTILR